MNYLTFVKKYARLFVLLSIVLPVVCGVAAYNYIPKEGNPEITVPVTVVVTPYPGASPEEVEKLVTTKIEEELDKLDDVDEIRSTSSENVSVVVVEFDVEADIERKIQDVKAAVSDARDDLPAEAEDSVVEKIDFSDIPLMIVSVSGEQHPLRLKRIAEDMADELDRIPEVQETVISGGLTREIQIYAVPEKLDRFGLTILDLYAAVLGSDVNIPAGDMTVSRRKYLIRSETEVEEVQDFRRIPVAGFQGRVVYLDEVAEIRDGFEEDRTYSRVDGRPAVSIAVKKRPGANILLTSAKVRERLAELEQSVGEGITTFVTADQAKFVRQDFDLMTNSAVSGLILVIIVLYFAMGLRNALLTSLAIPLSLAASFFVMFLMGMSNNSMVRFSLVLCIGILVDNAIVVVENVYHHARLGKDRIRAVMDGVSEIALPVISATLTTVAAFVPMLLMTGTVGAWMAFMPKTVSVALSCSLFVALISNPLILMKVLKEDKTPAGAGPRAADRDLARMKRLYEKIIIRALNHPGKVAGLCVLLLLGAFTLLGTKAVEVEMFPDADFDYLYIDVEAPPGTDIDVTDGIARRVEEIIRTHVPEAVRVVATVGSRGQSAYEISVQSGTNSNYAEITIELLEGKEYRRASHREIQARLRPLFAAVPGVEIKFRPIEWGPPRVAPITVKVFGEDIPVLRGITEQVVSTLKTVRGAVEVADDFSDAPPEILVKVDRAKAAVREVSLQDLSLTLRGVISGLETKEFRDETDASKEYDVSIRFQRESRQALEMLDRVKVRSADGSLVYLSSMAEMEPREGVNVIRHSNLDRVVRITAQNLDRSAVEVTEELRKKLAGLTLPEGYTIDYAGDVEETEESFASLRLAYLVAFLLILTILVAQFNSFFQPFAILISLPLSVVGAVAGLWITGNNFSIMSFVGLVGLSGIVVNDAIVLVDCINRFRKQGMEIYRAVIDAGKQRLRPIISTTVTTIGGLVPLTITDELWEGLGVVIIAGIGCATLLTLVVVPTGYMVMERFSARLFRAFGKEETFEVPPGKVYVHTPPRTLWLQVGFFLLLQGVFLWFGTERWILPVLRDIQALNVQAPTIVKWVLEAVVTYLLAALELLLMLVVLFLPALLLWLTLKLTAGRRRRYVALTPEGLTVNLALEPVTIPWDAVKGVRFRNRAQKIVVKTDLQRYVLGPLEERIAGAEEPKLWTWLGSGRGRKAKEARNRAFGEVKEEMGRRGR